MCWYDISHFHCTDGDIIQNEKDEGVDSDEEQGGGWEVEEDDLELPPDMVICLMVLLTAVYH